MGRRHLATAAVGLVTLAVFVPVIGHGFINWDDDRNVYENRRLDPVTLNGLASFWRAPTFHIYMPVTQTAWALVATWTRRPEATTPMQRFDPRPFHALNALLHAVNAMLVVLLLQRLGLGAGAACLGAFLFALHPVQVEPVAWVTGLKDVASGAWSLAAIVLYMTFAARDPDRSRSEPGSVHRAVRRRFVYGLATLAFVLAMLSKPTALALPLLVALLDRVAPGRRSITVLRSTAPWLVLSAACLALNVIFQPLPKTAVAPWARLWVALDALGFDLLRVVLPLRFAIDYGRTPAVLFEQPWLRWAPWLALGFIAGLVLLRRHARRLTLAGAVFVVALVPVLGFVPFGYQDISTVADRYLYLAMIGPAMIFGLAWARYRSPAPRALVLSALLGLVAVNLLQQRAWRSPTTLFEHALKVNARSRVAHFNLGVACAADGRVSEAARHFETLLAWDPFDFGAENSLGMTLAQVGRFDEALVHFHRAVMMRPDDVAARLNLAGALVHCVRIEEARLEYEAALRVQPDLPAAHYDLANLLAAQGRLEEAIAHYVAALAADPSFAPAHARLGQARRLRDAR